MSDIGLRIREARKLRGLTGKQLGELLKVSQASIHKWETGIYQNPRRDTIVRIAEALRINLQWLLTGEGEVELHGRATPQTHLRDLEYAHLNPKDVGSRIKEARASYPNITYGVEPSGISQADLANKIGVDDSLISKWEAGERAPSKEQIKPLADALGVKLKWLAFGEGDKDRFPVPDSAELQNITVEWREIPVLGYVPGGDPFAAEQIPEGTMMLLSTVSKHPFLFGLNVRGDSMSPKIEDGDQVAVEPVEGEPPTGSIVVALINGETTCKIFRRTGQGRPVLIPLNPVVEPIFLNRDDRILGVVIVVVKTLKPL